MIKLLKNKEVRKALLWQLLLSAAACAVCFFFDIRAGLTAAGLSLLLMLIYCVSTYRRYQSIAALADDIDQILHGDHAIDFDSYSEGELSILHSEIYKMTIRLREQQQTLTREKAYLADSIADISHQIRTPLTSINLLIGLLSEPKLTDARRQQLIHALYPGIALMNPGANLFTDGICQNILEQFPVFITQKPLLLFCLRFQPSNEIRELHLHAAVPAHQVNTPG